MTERVRTLVIQLDRDIRVDEVESVKTAIRMIKGVSVVEDGEVVGLNEHLARDAALRSFIVMLMEFLSMNLMNRYVGKGDQLKQICSILDQSYRERTGRGLFD